MGDRRESNKGHNKTFSVYGGPAVDIANLSTEEKYAVCQYAALFTYGEDAVKNVFGNAVKIGDVNTVETVNQMINFGGIGATPEEKAAFEATHPEWAATIKAYVDWKKAQPR